MRANHRGTCVGGDGVVSVARLVVVVTRDMVVRVIVGRIATVAVVIAIGVVVRIHRRHVVWVRTIAWRRRWHHRTIAIIVVAVVAGTVIVTWTWADMDDHPRLVAIAVPAEADGLEVLEGGKAEQLIPHLIVGHHRVGP